MVMQAFDLVLLFGLTARLTLFVVSDDLGKWLIRDPAMKWVGNSMRPDQLSSEIGRAHV